MVRSFAAAIAVLVGACLQSPLVPCGDLDCAPGSICIANACASMADVAACDGHADGDACRAANGGAGTCENGVCHTGLCGNGHLDVGEACDDGNQTSGDGCRGDCGKVEVCGDGELDQGEACDDGNHNAADGCDMCKRTVWNATTAVGMELAATNIALADAHGIAFDGSGRVFVADTFNHRILRIELDGSVTTIAGTGVPGYSGDGGTATAAQLQYPAAIAVDGIGRVFIADAQNARIRRIDTDGTIDTIAGTGTAGYSGDGGNALLAELANPDGVAVDGLGRVIIADSDNNRIRLIDTSGTIDTIAGTGVPGYSGDGGAATLATLDDPQGVALDAAGRVLIADTSSSAIRRINANGTITTIAGDGNSGFSGDGGAATTAELSFPVGIAVDAAGQIFIADTLNQRIRKIDAGGMIDTVAGDGNAQFAGDGAMATLASLQNPFGVAVDAQGRIAIADTSNERIREVNLGGIMVTLGGNGTFGFGGDGGMATSAQLANPFAVATDTMGRVYIADTQNQRIRRVELDGRITTVAGTGVQGFSGDGGPATSAELARPEGVAIDATGRIFIADTYNNRVRMVDGAGVITTVAGTGAPAVLQNPNAVAVDPQGRIVIADTYNHRLRRADLVAGTLTTIAGNGSFGYGGDGGQAISATLSFPYALTVDGNGVVIFGDTANNRVRAIATDGTITTIAGTGTPGFSGDGGAATSAKIDQPYGVAVDPQGRIVFADWNNYRIRRIATNGTISTVAGVGTGGASGDAAAGTSAQLQLPIGVAVDPQGAIIIADTNNDRVRRVDPTTGTITTIAGKIDPGNVGPVMTARLEDPQALTMTASLTLVAGGTSGTVEAVSGGRVIAVAGRYPQGTATGTLARYRTQTFGSVSGVAVDETAGVIYFTETSSNRLHVVNEVSPDTATWTIATLANTAGTAGFADGSAATAKFRAPHGLYLDAAAHTLYIADTGNHAIRALDLQSQQVTTVVNTSHSLGFGGDDGPATTALLFQPSALTRCPNGDMFIADTGNNRIRRVTAGTITTVLGDGIPASSGEGTPARTFPVDAPRGLGCDATGDLFVTSSTAVRLLPADDTGIVDGSGPVQTIYGSPPRATFPSSVTDCLTGLTVVGPTTIQVADACTGLLVQLDRAAAP